MKIKNSYDYVIIGSGFGGSVSALRLAEKGYKVLIIEKGKKYEAKDFAKTNWDLPKWLWLPELKLFGIQKLTFFRHISVLSGVGVGGGSLVYANTLPKPKPPFYNHGSWAKLADWETELREHYETAWKMLGAVRNKVLTESDFAVKELAKQMNIEDSFQPTKVAIYFGEEGKEAKDPYFNGKGPDRKGCTLCGSCMTGCRENAKNTLDKNYLHLAQQLGVEILPEHRVTDVIPSGENGENGYKIIFKQSTKYFSKTKEVKAKGIVFSGGVLGTVPLLLKLKRTSLPNLSDRVGDMIRTNNESLILNTTVEDKDMSTGIAIGSIVQVDEHSHLEPVRYGKGSGFWRPTLSPMVNEKNFFKRVFKLMVKPFEDPIKWFKVFFVDDFAKRTSILLFMQHLDSTLKFREGWFGLLKSQVDKGKAPTAFIEKANQAAKLYAKIINGKSQVIITESITGIPSTAHILGGASMGENAKEGVIDKYNHVFGYKNMYVFDGSMISANPGVNPSLSITAISERGMSHVPKSSNFQEERSLNT